MTVYQHLQQLGIKLPDLAPTYEFLPVNIIGDFVFVSGHAPFDHGEFLYRGKIGREFDVEAGKCAAQSAVLGCLASLQHALASLDKVRQIVKLNGYVNCTPEFHDLPLITDAASTLLVGIFGDSGRHARTTVGVSSLPADVAVEIELIARLESRELFAGHLRGLVPNDIDQNTR